MGDQPGQINLDVSSAERGDYEVGDEVTLLLPTGELRQTFELVGTSNFNGGGTAGATLALLETSAAQDLFLDGEDAFTTVSLTAAEGVSQTELADAAKTVLPDGFTAGSVTIPRPGDTLFLKLRDDDGLTATAKPVVVDR